MRYQHKWNKEATCTIKQVPTKQTPYYILVRNGEEFRQNKEIFEKEWEPIKNKL